MKKKLVTLLSVILVISSFALFISCGGKITSLQNIEIDLNSSPKFVPGDNTVSAKQAEKESRIINFLNKALDDYPDLTTMLEADTIDGGSNSYIYESSESFFKILQEFTDENFSKTKSMFPDITEEEFYYHSAVAYSKANHNPEIFETPYIEFQISTDIKTFTPTFSQLMATAFWVSYTSERFDVDYGNKNNLPIEKRFEIKSLDSDSSFELAMIMHIASKETIANGEDIEVGKRFGPKKEGKIISQYLVNYQRDMLREDGGVKKVSLDEDDYFFQMGNISSLIALISEHFPSKESYLLMGNLAVNSGYYMNAFDISLSRAAGLTYSSLISVSIAGQSVNFKDYYEVMLSGWSVHTWQYSGVKDMD